MIRPLLAAAGLAAAVACPAAAEDSSWMSPKSDGQFMVRARALFVLPKDDVKVDGLPGAGANLSTSVVPELDFTYFITPNIAAELILGTTPHSLTGTGVVAGADLGDVWLLPPTLTLQYHVTQLGEWSGDRALGKIKPYVGAGVNYTIFYGESSGALGKVRLEDTFGIALQAGVDIEITEGIYFNADVKYIFLETDWKATGGATGKATINPVIIGAGLGYRF